MINFLYRILRNTSHALIVAALLFLLLLISEAGSVREWAHYGYGLGGAQFGLLWGVALLGILVWIAIFPPAGASLPERGDGKVWIFSTMAILVPFALCWGLGAPDRGRFSISDLELMPFIMLIGAIVTTAFSVYAYVRGKQAPRACTGVGPGADGNCQQQARDRSGPRSYSRCDSGSDNDYIHAHTGAVPA